MRFVKELLERNLVQTRADSTLSELPVEGRNYLRPAMVRARDRVGSSQVTNAFVAGVLKI